MSYHSKSKEEVLTLLDTTAIGLSSEEARKRLSQNGKNKLKEGKMGKHLKYTHKSDIYAKNVYIAL